MKRIQLIHPQGKKAISMDSQKYEWLREAIVESLTEKGEMTHDQLFSAVRAFIKKQKIPFEGSIDWNAEWVKLDLESRKIIKRISVKSPVLLALNSRA